MQQCLFETLIETRAPHAGPAVTNMGRKERRRAEREGRAYEDAAERKAAPEAEGERLADEAATKLAERVEALRAGFAASVADWKAARAAAASRAAAHEQELNELLARRRELAGTVKAALSGAPDDAAVSRGGDALKEIQDLVDEARALLEPPPPSNDYGWSPFEP